LSETPERLLLDTHALFWAVTTGLKRAAADLVVEVGKTGGLLISPVSAWELGLLANPRYGPPRVRLDPTPARWFADVLESPANSETPLTIEIGLDATMLPGDFHRDPADRLLVATARILDVPIMTRDSAILDYAAQGHVRAIIC
jgi:PIN domain nuclease of toxin-antitoxin system